LTANSVDALYGDLLQSGGTLRIANALTIGPNQAIPYQFSNNWYGSYQISQGTLQVDTLNVMKGGLVWIHGGQANYKNLNIQGGVFRNNTVQVNSAGSNLNVQDGALVGDLSNYGNLSGSDVITGSVENSGTMNPGNSPGTLTIVGKYTQTATGRHIVEVASASNYDRLAVTGTASLDGTLAPTLYSDFQARGNQIFSGVVTAAGGVTGTFSTIANQQFTPTLSWQTRYNPASVDLWVQRNYTNQGLGLNVNQQAVGAALNSLAGVTSGDLDTVRHNLDYLPNAGAVQEALQEISPQKAAALSNLAFTSASFQMRNQAQRLTDLRFADWAAALEGGVLAEVNPFGSRQFSGLMLAFNSPSLSGMITQERPSVSATSWNVYLYPSVILCNQQTTANQTGYTFYMAGFTLGADYRVQDNLLVRLSTGYSYTNADFKGSVGGVQTNTLPLTVYAAFLEQSFYAYGSLGYTLNLFNQQRGIQFGGLKRIADSSTTGNQLNAYGEAGYDLKPNPFIVTPVVSLAYSGLWLNGYGESGAGSLNLDVASQNATSLQTGVGLKVVAPCRVGGATMIPQVYATYQHEFATNSRGLIASLSQGGGTFTFQTDAPSRDFAVVGAKLDLLTRKNLQFSLNYSAEVGRVSYLAQSIYAGVRLVF
jgi:uncharacterized protein with beta-barrel porin domain